MKTRTIVHVIPTLNVGGAEKQLALLVRDMDRDRFRPLVACTTRGGPLLEEFARNQVPVQVIGKRGRFDASLVWRLGRWLRRQRPDLVHTWMFTANTWGRLAALTARVPAIVASERCVDHWKGALHHGLDRLLATATDRIVANSHAVARSLIEHSRIPASRIRVVHNGLDAAEADRLGPRPRHEVTELRQALGLPPGALVVGDVSRLDAKNDLLSWASVLERLASRHPEVVGVVAGSASLAVEHRYARRLQDEIRRRGLEARVRLLGLRRDLEHVLPALDLFLHTSATEGFPNAVMEAMAAALPVVATRAGGTPELVQHGATGYLAPVGDVEALADHASRLLSDPVLRRSLGEAAARRVREQFTTGRMVEATQDVYEEVLAEASQA